MKQSKSYPARRTLARLNEERKARGIENVAIAERASRLSKRGHVGVATVSNALTGLRKSWPVVVAVRELLAEAKSAQQVEQAS